MIISQSRSLIIFIISLYSILWGTSWLNFFLEYNVNTILSPLILIIGVYCFIKNNDKLSTDTYFFYFLFLIFLTAYFCYGYQIIFEYSSKIDINYLIEYSLKLIVLPLLALVLPSIFRCESDIRKFLFYVALFFIPIYLFLHYRYVFIYELPFVGVQLEGNGKLGKNSFAGAIVLLFPLITALYFQKKNTLIFLALVIMSISMVYLSSRSAIIALIFEILIFMFVTHSKKIRRSLFLLITIIIVSISYMKSEELKRFFLKETYEGKLERLEETSIIIEDGVEIDFMQQVTGKNRNLYYFFDTHRGWLLHESLSAFIEGENLFGNGLSTFRVRPTNNGSKTNTHNDYSLIIYETGILGISFLLIFFSYLIFKSYKLIKKNNNYLLESSLSSLIGLAILLFFTNLLQSYIFWLIIGINISITKYLKQNI